MVACICRLLVQIVQLRWDYASDGDGLFWESLCDCLVNVTMTCVEVSFAWDAFKENRCVYLGYDYIR